MAFSVASLFRGGNLFLLALAIFPSIHIGQFPNQIRRAGKAGEGSARRGPQVRVIGALLTGAAKGPPTDPLVQLTEEVCVANGQNYAPQFLQAVDLSSIPNTPAGNVPPIQGALGALQKSRWDLLPRTSVLFTSLVHHVSPSPQPAPPWGRPGGTEKDFARKDNQFRGITAEPQTGFASIGGAINEDEDTEDEKSVSRGNLPQEEPLPLYDAVFVYLRFIAQYLTLMALGVLVVVLAIPLLIVLLCRPASLCKSTGGFVHLFCFSPAPGSKEDSGVEPLTEKDDITQGGAVGEMKASKGLSMLSEEAMTQSGAELKTFEENEGMAEAEAQGGKDANSHAADVETPLKKARRNLEMWTGKYLGLGLLLALLLSVLVCVSLGLGQTARLSQALHAAHCALTAAVVQVFEGSQSSRERLIAVINQWEPGAFPEPEGPKEDDDFKPGSPEHQAALLALFRDSLGEENAADMAERYEGSSLLELEEWNLANDSSFSSHFRRLAARSWEYSDDNDDANDDDSSMYSNFGFGTSPAKPSALARRPFSSSQKNHNPGARAKLSFENMDDDFENLSDKMNALASGEFKIGSPKQSANPRAGFGGIRPFVRTLKQFQRVSDKKQSSSFSATLAALFGQSLSMEHYMLMLYDHLTAMELMMEASVVPQQRGGLFDHFCLGKITFVPFSRVLTSEMGKIIDLLREVEENLQEFLGKASEQEDKISELLQQVDTAEDGVEKIAQQLGSYISALSHPRSVVIPAILYTWGVVLTLVLVSTAVYLLYLNRKPASQWETGDIPHRPAGWLWWSTFLVAGATIVLGAVLLTVAVFFMDTCIYISEKVQDPHGLQELLEPRLEGSLKEAGFENIAAACAGRTDARDLAGVLPIDDIRAAAEDFLGKAKDAVKQARSDELITEIFHVTPRIIDLADSHAGLFLLRDDVRRNSASGVVYMSGIHNVMKHFRCPFHLPQASPLHIRSDISGNYLLSLPAAAPTLNDLAANIHTQMQKPLGSFYKEMLDTNNDVVVRLKMVSHIFRERRFWGYYGLYGLREVETAIQPFFFGVYTPYRHLSPEEQNFMVDNNSDKARQATQNYLSRLPPNERDTLGDALELARRKANVRPGAGFTCVKRNRHAIHGRRREDLDVIRRKIAAYQTNTDAFDDFSGYGETGIQKVEAGRELIFCDFEEYSWQIQREAQGAMYALASLHHRMHKLWAEIERAGISRADALVDSVQAMAESLDCTPVYRGLLTAQHLICQDSTEQLARLGVVWLITSLLSLILFFIVFFVWRYLTGTEYKRRETERRNLEAARAAEQAAEEARRLEEERVAAEEAAAAKAAASAARVEARARQVSAAALNRQRTSVQRAQSVISAPLQIQARDFGARRSVRDLLAAQDQGESVVDTMWADSGIE